MDRFCCIRTFVGMLCACLIALTAWGIPTQGQQPPQQDTSPPMAQGGDKQAAKLGMQDEGVAHPFFTHMRLPEAVGVFNLRFAGLATRDEGQTAGAFAFHFETGLTKHIGVHLRYGRFLERPRAEVMFQFAAVQRKNGMRGFPPVVEFEIQTFSGNGTRIHTLVGFSTALSNSRASFNQVIHGNPREDTFDGSAASVFKAGKPFYPVIEALAEAMRGDQSIAHALFALYGGRERVYATWLCVSGGDNSLEGLLLPDGVAIGHGVDTSTIRRTDDRAWGVTS